PYRTRFRSGLRQCIELAKLRKPNWLTSLTSVAERHMKKQSSLSTSSLDALRRTLPHARGTICNIRMAADIRPSCKLDLQSTRLSNLARYCQPQTVPQQTEASGMDLPPTPSGQGHNQPTQWRTPTGIGPEKLQKTESTRRREGTAQPVKIRDKKCVRTSSMRSYNARIT